MQGTFHLLTCMHGSADQAVRAPWLAAEEEGEGGEEGGKKNIFIERRRKRGAAKEEEKLFCKKQIGKRKQYYLYRPSPQPTTAYLSENHNIQMFNTFKHT